MNKRLDIIDRESDIRQWIKEKKTKAYISKELSCKPNTLNTYLDKMGIEYHGNRGGSGLRKPRNTGIDLYLSNKRPIQSNKLKRLILKSGLKDRRCERCGNEKWCDVDIPLELHHIDGNCNNNAIDNLELLCPNCHALTDNYRGKNIRVHLIDTQNCGNSTSVINKHKSNKRKNFCVDCGKKISVGSVRCNKCRGFSSRKVDRPDRSTLKELIRNTSFLKIGKQFRVSDNAVRKWCSEYGLPTSRRVIKEYKDTEWEQI